MKRKRKQKLEIVFDPKKRKEFLTGFRKRKNERRQKAKEQLENLLLQEKKELMKQVKNRFSLLKKSYEPIPELELSEDEENYDHGHVEVKVLSLGNNLTEEQEENEDSRDQAELSDDNSSDNNDIPGMSLKRKTKPNLIKDNEAVIPTSEKEILTKKKINRMKRDQATKFIKNSKLFKVKEKMERLKNKKKARQLKKNLIKSKKKLKGKNTRKGYKP